MSEIRRAPNQPTLAYLQPGETIGHFLINEMAGKGATSHVYRALNTETYEPVAVKVLNASLAKDEKKRERALKEAEMMMQLDHRNVVYFHEVFDIDGGLAFVMEYIDGLQLDQWLQTHSDSLDEQIVICLFMDILRGLNHAHENGIFHRDLKPANIMVTQEGGRWVAKIIDFGVARVAHEPIPEEEKAKIVGTAAYISPEEIRDPETVCESSDIYSIGVMLYEALCGRRPFQGLPVPELMKAHVKQNPERPRAINPHISSNFEVILLRSLTKRPESRFASATELMLALEKVAQSHDPNSNQFKAYDPEANVLTSVWDRSTSSRNLLIVFQQMLAMAMSYFWHENRGHAEKSQLEDNPFPNIDVTKTCSFEGAFRKPMPNPPASSIRWNPAPVRPKPVGAPSIAGHQVLDTDISIEIVESPKTSETKATHSNRGEKRDETLHLDLSDIQF